MRESERERERKKERWRVRERKNNWKIKRYQGNRIHIFMKK